MKTKLLLLALLPLTLLGQVQNSKLAQGLLMAVQSGANALSGANIITDANGRFTVDASNASDANTAYSGVYSFNTSLMTTTISSGVVTMTKTDTGVRGLQIVGLTTGVTYTISGLNVTSITGTWNISGDGSDANQYGTITTTGIKSFTFKATSTSIYILSTANTSVLVLTQSSYAIACRPINASALTLPDPSYTLSNSGAIPTYGHKGNNSYFEFDGVDDITTYAYTTASSSFAIWIYPTVTNKLWINMGTNMTIGIDGSNDLALGSALTNPTKYVNGVVSNAVTLNAWNYIVIKCDEITPTTLQFGYVSSSYGGFNLKGVSIFNYALSDDDVTYYSDPANHPRLVDQTATGTDIVSGWNFTSGWVGTATVNDSTTFTATGQQWIRKQLGLIAGRKYRIISTGTSSENAVNMLNYDITTSYGYATSINNIITAIDGGISFLTDGSSVVDISYFSVTEAGATLILSPEGMLNGIWRDYYHDIDVTVGTGSTSPRLVKDFAGLNAWRFSGTSYLSGSVNLDNATSFSISSWVFLTSLPTWAIIYSNGMNGSSGLMLGVSSNDISFVIPNSNYESIETGSDYINTGTWYHIVATYDGYNARIYLNGVLVKSGALTKISSGGDYSLVGAAKTGAPWNNWSSEYFIGIIEGLGVYQRALTADEILLDYQVYQD